MKRNYTIIPLFLLLFVAMVACSNKSRNNADSEGKQPQSTVNVPQFDADSAYQYVKAQVDFGPRVPNTAAHRACGEYLVKKLEQFGATVCSQQVDLIAYDGTLLKARNIIGSYKPETKNASCFSRTGTAAPGQMPTPMKRTGTHPSSAPTTVQAA